MLYCNAFSLKFPKKVKKVWVHVSFEVYNAYNLTSSDLLPVVFLSSIELLLPGVLGKSVGFFKGFHSLKEEIQQGSFFFFYITVCWQE